MLLLRNAAIESTGIRDERVLGCLIGKRIEFVQMLRIRRIDRLRDRGIEIGQAAQHGVIAVGQADDLLLQCRRRIVAVHLREGILEHAHQRLVAMAARDCRIELLQIVGHGSAALFFIAPDRRIAHVDVDVQLAGRSIQAKGALRTVGMKIQHLRRFLVERDVGMEIHRRQHRRIELRQRAKIDAWRSGVQAVNGFLERIRQVAERDAFRFAEFAAGFDADGEIVVLVLQRNLYFHTAFCPDCQLLVGPWIRIRLRIGDRVDIGRLRDRLREIADAIFHHAHQSAAQILESIGKGVRQEITFHQ